jgi:phosphogluconate dehydratase
MDAYRCAPVLENTEEVAWTMPVIRSFREDVLAPFHRPFTPEGGLRCLSGNLGQSVIKVSAVAEEHHFIKAPCTIFHCQDSLRDAFEAGDLDRDVVAVVRFQGPAANGMPELHKMTPYLGSLQDRGFNVALITDGRMSGASGKVPAAIHLTPEAIHGGPIALLRDGDIVELDTIKGTLTAQVPEQEWLSRTPAPGPPPEDTLGRNLFDLFRNSASGAMLGASVFEPAKKTQ